MIASIDDEVQENWLINNLLARSAEGYLHWIGLVGIVSNYEQWFWLGDSKSYYRHWVVNEPTNGHAELCSLFDNHGWWSTDCDSTHRLVVCRAKFQKSL